MPNKELKKVLKKLLKKVLLCKSTQKSTQKSNTKITKLKRVLLKPTQKSTLDQYLKKIVLFLHFYLAVLLFFTFGTIFQAL